MLILRYLEYLDVSVAAFLAFAGALVTALLVGITVHEFSHALAADSLGDPTPRYRGRLTLNPRAHLDPFGTFLLFAAGFGWGKPVPVNPNLMRGHDPRTAMAIVAAAGPLSNLVMAGLAGLAIKIGLVDWHTPFVVNKRAVAVWDSADFLGLYVSSIVIIGIILAIFNLTPLFPLDGFSVALGILPRDLADGLEQLRAWGPGLLLMFIFGLPLLTGFAVNPFWWILEPAVNGLAGLMTGVDTDVFG